MNLYDGMSAILYKLWGGVVWCSVGVVWANQLICHSQLKLRLSLAVTILDTSGYLISVRVIQYNAGNHRNINTMKQ